MPADGGTPETPDGDGFQGECTQDAECPDGFACLDLFCFKSCAAAADCPTGYFCDSVGHCGNKLCSIDADCTDASLSKCSPTLFRCEAPVVTVAPTIVGFRASPPAAVLDKPTPVTFVWDLGTEPAFPAAACDIDNDVGDVTGLESVVAQVTGAVLPTTYTLTCTNSVGTATASVVVPGLPTSLVGVDVEPAGGTYQLGGVTLVVPPGAVADITQISSRLSNVFAPSPDLVSLPVEFYPDGFRFLQPVTLTLPVNTTLLGPAGWNVALEDLHVTVSGDGRWRLRVNTTANVGAGTLAATVGHFSEAAASAAPTCDAPPLSLPRKTLVRREEILRLGCIHSSEGSGTGIVYDDLKQTDREKMARVSDALGTNLTSGTMFSATTGDFDGDGRDEVVVATRYTDCSTRKARLFVLDSCGESARAEDCWNDFTVIKTINLPGASRPSINTVAVAAGDLDGDGMAEIAAVVDYSGGGGELFRFDDTAHSYATIGASTHRGDFEHWADLQIAVGDFNHRVKDDQAEEIVVTGTYLDFSPRISMMYAFPDATDDYYFSQRNLDQNNIGKIFPANNISRPSVAIADIDNNGDGEIVVAAIDRAGAGKLYVEAFRVRDDQNDFVKVDATSYTAPRAWYNHMSPLIVGVDFNGDGRSEVAVIQREKDTAAKALFFALGDAKTAWSGARLIGDRTRSNGPHYLASGDVDGDLKEDVVIAELRSDRGDYDIAVYSGSGSRVEWKAGWRPLRGPNNWRPVLAVGDFDGDSLKVRFTGECTATTVDFRPLVAVAAPPVGLALSQNREDSDAQYGSSTTTSQSESNTVSQQDSITLSLSSPFMSDVFDASASSTLEREFTKTNTTTEEVTIGSSFTNPWRDGDGHNFIEFVKSEYISYRYEILAAPDAQALTEENRYLTIDVPQGGEHRWVTQEEYNAQAPSSKEIGVETFPHTPGDHLSYRTFSECDDLIATSGWKSADAWVAQSPGAQTVSLEMSSAATNSEAKATDVSFEAGVSVAGVGFSYGRGVRKERAYEVSVGESTSYSGTVGGISDNYWTDSYKFRLIAYTLKRSNALAYTVVDFCVDE